MARKVHGRLLNAVADYLGVVGSENVGSVDLESVILTHDVQRALEQGIVLDWTFVAELTMGANTNTQVILQDFRSTGNWSHVYRRGQDFQGNTAEGQVPRGHDMLIFQVGLGSPNGDTNIAEQGLWFQQGGNRMILAYADTLVLNNAMMHGDGPTILQPLPWFMPSQEPYTALPTSLAWAKTASDALQPDVGLVCRVLSAPPGILRPTR